MEERDRLRAPYSGQAPPSVVVETSLGGAAIERSNGGDAATRQVGESVKTEACD